jgi:hypothetical protein
MLVGPTIGTLVVVARCAGLRGAFVPPSDPQPLSEMWWLWPIYSTSAFVLWVCWPWRHKDEMP